ncbi:hypothetical protein MYX84_05920 [Acidobacteria bacterium AH-259-O06]|nr:hypothetical protein [Acidobacteria bacterium AH-259-O06]
MERTRIGLIFLVLGLVLALAGSPVQAQGICNPEGFCDRDGDTWFKVHQRCTTCPDFDNRMDCDDSVSSEENICGDGTSTVYSASLAGAFVFDVHDGVVDVTLNSKGNTLRSDQDVEMKRPLDPLDLNLDETWDEVFATCTELLTGQINSIFVGDDDWLIEAGPGNIVIQFKDIRLQNADITLQLTGVPNEPFPPAPGNTSVFFLDQFSIHGRSAKGGPGGSMGCQPRGGGSFDIFDLLVPNTLLITAP